MNITKQQLQQLIKEETAAALAEGGGGDKASRGMALKLARAIMITAKQAAYNVFGVGVGQQRGGAEQSIEATRDQWEKVVMLTQRLLATIPADDGARGPLSEQDWPDATEVPDLERENAALHAKIEKLEALNAKLHAMLASARKGEQRYSKPGHERGKSGLEFDLDL